MKANFLKSIVLVFVILAGLNSCNKKTSAQEKMMKQGILFIELTAQQYSVGLGKTININAIISNACPEITYYWTASSGSISGNSSKITFNAPVNDAQVEITCLVKHPGLESKTKSIIINVQ